MATGGMVRVCACCQAAKMAIRKVRTSTGYVLMAMCADCDTRTCHYGSSPGSPDRGVHGNAGCPFKVVDLYAKKCPAGHPL